MKTKTIVSGCIILLSLLHTDVFSQSGQTTWTYTYLKAQPNQRENLKLFLEKNWFAMDSIAVSQKLIRSYELLIHVSETPDKDWDFIVAVEYFENQPYEVIADRFNLIRQSHRTKLIDGLGLKDLGRITKSELVRKSTATR
ncbi:MAG: hypothetical protein HYZ44_11630 [Bacteroidetes bacterium]|nr:hypothetical protein [Bacteroidota bacterium]